MTSAPLADLDRCIDAFMAVIDRQGWHQATLENIAREAGIPVWQLVLTAGNRFDMLAKFGRRADIAALRSLNPADAGQSTRDRLFDLIMARFDAHQPFRGAIQNLVNASYTDPGLAAFFACQLPRSIGVIADAAGVKTSGLSGMAQVQGLTLLYLSVTRTWLRDDTQDMSRTMSALDQALARAERWCRQMDWRASPRHQNGHQRGPMNQGPSNQGPLNQGPVPEGPRPA